MTTVTPLYWSEVRVPISDGGLFEVIELARDHGIGIRDAWMDPSPGDVPGNVVLAVDTANTARYLRELSRSGYQASVRELPLSEIGVEVADRDVVWSKIQSLAGDLGIRIYGMRWAHSAEGTGETVTAAVETSNAVAIRRALTARGHESTVRELS
jgi:hypothetical protein